MRSQIKTSVTQRTEINQQTVRAG